MNHVDKKQQGFTIIELMLAMTFVAFLLIGISATIIQFGTIYNQGTTTKEINQASRDLNNDLKRTISTAGTLKLSTDFVLSPHSASVDASTADGGRLCLGTYSYLWNYAKALKLPIAAGAITYQDNSVTPQDESRNLIRMVKVVDPSKSYCALNATGGLNLTKVSVADQVKTVELLKSGDHDLGIHQFVIPSLATSAEDGATGQKLYSISYVIGTSQVSALNSDQSECVASDKPGADPLYCNVQQFGLVIRAGE